MAFPSVMKLVFDYVIFTIFCIALLAVSASPFQFQVGSERGWIKPSGNETETNYDKWATKNRFHVGDTLCKFTVLCTVHKHAHRPFLMEH